MLAKAVAAIPAHDAALSVETLSVPGPGDDPLVRVLAYRPKQVEGSFPVLLHLHGGGYVVGSPERKGAEHRKLAVDLGCVIYSVDYRLAPETPFPVLLKTATRFCDGFMRMLWSSVSIRVGSV